MFKNYLKIAFRNLIRNRLHSTINILGLSIAIGVCIVGYVNYNFSQSFDKFHKNSDSIYGIHAIRLDNNKEQIWTQIPLPMSEKLKDDIPGIIGMSRYHGISGTLQYGDKVFKESFKFVDPDFYTMLSSDIVNGRSNDLADRAGIVLTKDVANKFFGTENPIGKQMTISRDNEIFHTFIVQAVIQNALKNSALEYSVLIPFSSYGKIADIDIYNWRHRAHATLIQLSPNASIADVEQKLNVYIDQTNAPDPNWQIQKFQLEPIHNMAYLDGNDALWGDPYHESMHPASIIAPSVVAFLILLLACFNFMTLSISSSGQRLKEIGVRKAIGAFQRHLMFQFLGENIILCLFALIVGLAFGELFVSYYDSLWPEISLVLNYSKDAHFLLFLFGLIIFIAIVAGLYPAQYISKFNPVSIFRGKQKFAGNSVLIRSLLTFQFVLAIINIMAGVSFFENAEFMRTTDPGFNIKNIIQIPLNRSSDYDIYKNALANYPGVISIAATRNTIGNSRHSVEGEVSDQKTYFDLYRVGENYLNLLGINILKGQNFDHLIQSNSQNAIIVNEKFCETHSLSSPIGKYIAMFPNKTRTEFQIIGVVNDFRGGDIDQMVRPTVLQMASKDEYGTLAVQFDKASIKKAMPFLRTQWQQCFPHLPFRGYFMDEIRENELQIANAVKTVFLYISIIAALIVAMGLFALLAQNIEKRTKEIAIRQILGATITNIMQILLKDFILLFIITVTIAAATGSYLITMMLDSIWEVNAGFSMNPIYISTFAIISITIFTLAIQLKRIVGANPVDSLRYE